MSTEIYTPGYDRSALRFMRRRTLETHGAFARTLFRPGARVLDLGCGPGTITLDMARCIGPDGELFAVDRNAGQFTEAARLAKAENLPVHFLEMDVNALDLEPHTFDVVFSHALFEHLRYPVPVLKRVKRILKPGGHVALRCPDWGGFVLHPSDPATMRAIRALLNLQKRNGGDVHAGRKLGTWLRQAGFENVTVSAGYEIYNDHRPVVNLIAAQLDKAGRRIHGQSVRRWAQNPDALFAQAWFEAIGVYG
jgi:ubiquinone/menaquinone biosynthesis C-methylase UbiE